MASSPNNFKQVDGGIWRALSQSISFRYGTHLAIFAKDFLMPSIRFCDNPNLDCVDANNNCRDISSMFFILLPGKAA